MITAPLRRNRDFVLLQAGQFLSHAGTHFTLIAYPLLVLELTGSAAKAGLVSFARMLPWALLALPAGLASDRWNRKRLMVVADVVRVLAVGTLAAAIVLGEVEFWLVPVVAFVEGCGGAFFSASQTGALRAVVPRHQLPAAVSVISGRQAVVGLAAPPIGGALFGVARALPFVADAISYAFSTLSLIGMRTPFQEEREPEKASLRTRVAEGFRFLWGHSFLRVTAFLFGLTNFIGPGLTLAIVVIGRRQGLSGGEVGVLVALFAAGVLVGSFASPIVRRLLPVRGVMLLELWTWPGCALFLVWPNVYVLAASLIPTALAIPSTDSVVHSYQLAMTPDRLIGRVGSVLSVIALTSAPLGPLVAGVLLGAVSERATIAVFAATGLALALWGTLSPAIRDAPSLAEFAEDQPHGASG